MAKLLIGDFKTRKEYSKHLDKLEKKAVKKIKYKKGKKSGQTLGENLPTGYYMKGGQLHRFSPELDKQRVAKYKISSNSKDKWRGDSEDRY